MQDIRWYRLDNAATIVPSSVHGSDTRVFRIVCELKEEVDGEILQDALDLTVEEFPHFNVILRRGFFWFYLDSFRGKAKVKEENKPACAPLYNSGRRKLMYRVVYYKNRINLEMFHVLADGTGAFSFLKAIVTNYLFLKHGVTVETDELDSSSTMQKNEDAFRQFYTREKNREQLKGMLGTKAYQIEQLRDENLHSRLVEGVVSAKAFIDLSHKYNTTAGILTVALYIEAILNVMSIQEQRRPIVISVPVNLRQYFPSETTRNFFGVINVTFWPKDYDGTIESILAVVKSSFEEQLTKDKIQNTMNGYSGLTRNIALKVIPLFIKNPLIQLITKYAQKGTTATMSNLGKINMPKELCPYIKQFSAFMATPNVQICVSTFGDRMVFGAVSAFEEHKVFLNFFRGLTKRGLEVEIASNDYDKEEKHADVSKM
ncbi:MAG: hypothetical protein K6F30_01610 [Lachnospiraceae bacterium]|nr:hypothetical protein [Lachnospiraceae bacterium]